MMGKIPAVQPDDYGRIEGTVTDMGWIMAEQKFRDVFTESYEYCDPWDQVKKQHGCFSPQNPIAWARGMNAIISVLNNLPKPCSRADLRNAFGI